MVESMGRFRLRIQHGVILKEARRVKDLYLSRQSINWSTQHQSKFSSWASGHAPSRGRSPGAKECEGVIGDTAG